MLEMLTKSTTMKLLVEARESTAKVTTSSKKEH